MKGQTDQRPCFREERKTTEERRQDDTNPETPVVKKAPRKYPPLPRDAVRLVADTIVDMAGGSPRAKVISEETYTRQKADKEKDMGRGSSRRGSVVFGGSADSRHVRRRDTKKGARKRYAERARSKQEPTNPKEPAMAKKKKEHPLLKKHSIGEVAVILLKEAGKEGLTRPELCAKLYNDPQRAGPLQRSLNGLVNAGDIYADENIERDGYYAYRPYIEDEIDGEAAADQTAKKSEGETAKKAKNGKAAKSDSGKSEPFVDPRPAGAHKAIPKNGKKPKAAETAGNADGFSVRVVGGPNMKLVRAAFDLQDLALQTKVSEAQEKLRLLAATIMDESGLK